MNQRMDFSDDKLTTDVVLIWSTEYAMPLYKVDGKVYAPMTGEYGGYFDEVDIEGSEVTAPAEHNTPQGEN